MKRALLLLLLLVPASTALAVGDHSSTWTFTPPLDDHVEAHPPSEPEKNCTPDTSGAPPFTGRPGPPDYIRVVHPNGEQILEYTDPANEQACAEARFLVDVPDGALRLHIDFTAQREVGASAFKPHLVQKLRYYHADGAPEDASSVIECMEGEPYVEPNLIDQGVRKFSIEVRLDDPDCDEAIADALVVAWYFGDEQEPGTQPGAASELAVQQEATVRIQDISFVFPGLDMDVSIHHNTGLDPLNDVVGFEAAHVVLPSPQEHWSVTGAFSVPNNHSIHAFYTGLEPTPSDRLSNDLIDAQESGGWLHFTISQQLIQATGSREFTVHFIPEGTPKIEVERIPLAALVLLAPLAFGVIAQRNVNHLNRTARGRLGAVRWTLQGLLAAGWLVYVVVAFVLLVTVNGAGMAAWPLPPGNVIAYAALVVSGFTMIATAIAARRREMTLVRDDLTELERIKVELQRSNQELEQFAYVASHDLKEPLRMVAGFTQLLERHLDGGLDEDGRKYLGFASEGARRLQRMVDDLLAYSRVRHDKTSMRVVELDDVANIVKGHLSQLIHDRNVDLRIATMPQVVGDRGQLVQVLLNLVQNAIKFSPQDAPVVEVSARRRGGEVHVSVRDEGIGIDPAQQGRIFQIFQRLHLREDYEGNGIGLAMVKKIAEQAGGRVIVESTKGEGATFTVVLPDFVNPSFSTPVGTSNLVGGSA